MRIGTAASALETRRGLGQQVVGAWAWTNVRCAAGTRAPGPRYVDPESADTMSHETTPRLRAPRSQHPVACSAMPSIGLNMHAVVGFACSARTARQRVHDHPLTDEELITIVLAAWQDLLAASTGGLNLVRDVGIEPREIGGIMQKLIAGRLQSIEPGRWRGESSPREKDVVCLDDERYSFEIKTSSSKSGLPGNRSYASTGAECRKSKRGYYLAINYDNPQRTADPRVRRMRFGWLDQEDWRPQRTGTGQLARIRSRDAARQLITIYEI